jgi:phosphoribosylformylglycinamidine synthase
MYLYTKTKKMSEVKLFDKEMELETFYFNFLPSKKENAVYICTDSKCEKNVLKQFISQLFKHEMHEKSSLPENATIHEIGPKQSAISPWCSNVMSIIRSINSKTNIIRIEITTRSVADRDHLQLDKMTQQLFTGGATPDYKLPQGENVQVKKCKNIPLKELSKFNMDMTLNMDPLDLAFVSKLYMKLQRDPTDVELFDLAQSNSEHSRHHLFRGRLKELGAKEEADFSLMDLIREPLEKNNQRSAVAFSDNSSAIFGFPDSSFFQCEHESFQIKNSEPTKSLIICTAETHNFPTGIAPFQGATTGTGGRLRDVQAFGRGGLTYAGSAGYCVGEIRIDDEGVAKHYHTDYPFWTPTEILLKASDGASDYGNKYGEPIITGFTRAISNLHSRDVERVEFVKPIMYTSGLGFAHELHAKKLEPEESDLVVKFGGPAYRIGLGGGSFSSVGTTETSNTTCNRFGEVECAVQRGDAEMGNKLNRVVRACIELGDRNPIRSIHDQGAGGTGNVTKEICEGVGGKVWLDRIDLGDPTLTDLEIWCAEYQEQNTCLIKPDSWELFQKLCARENLPVCNFGKIQNTGKIEVVGQNGSVCVNLPLKDVLEDVPKKLNIVDFSKLTDDDELEDEMESNQARFKTNLEDFDFEFALRKVLNLISVGSKRFLIHKVDRSVSGLIAQQQAVGPYETPISNYCTIVQNYSDVVGAVKALGERPTIMLKDRNDATNIRAMVQMSVVEMLTNIMFAGITDMRDIKISANWMWPAKSNEGKGRLCVAAFELNKFLLKLGLAIDGGKDSVSMSSQVEGGETVESPDQLVICGYAPTENVNFGITPDLKQIGSKIIYIPINNSKTGYFPSRLGGSALERVMNIPLSDEVPNVENENICNVFETVNNLVKNGSIFSGHDISDGGMITSIVEMCISSGYGCSVDVTQFKNIPNMFSEEAGVLIEVTDPSVLEESNLLYKVVGKVIRDPKLILKNDQESIHEIPLRNLVAWWEAASLSMDKMQTNKEFAESQNRVLLESVSSSQKVDLFRSRFDLGNRSIDSFEKIFSNQNKHVGIIRCEGSNGDREMAAAFYEVGFQVYDVTMTDLLQDCFTLDQFDGLAFVGGFSFADALGAGRGWAAMFENNSKLMRQLTTFFEKPDSFSLSVCNGCQLMSQLNFIPYDLVANDCGKFESRFSYVKHEENKDILGVWIAHGEGKFVPRNHGSSQSDHRSSQSDHRSSQRDHGSSQSDHRSSQSDHGSSQSDHGSSQSDHGSSQSDHGSSQSDHRSSQSDHRSSQSDHGSSQSDHGSENQSCKVLFRYVDEKLQPTQVYPHNPNGSHEGIAGVRFGKNGRHIAMMPHPERCFKQFQILNGNESSYTKWIHFFNMIAK